MPMTFNNFLWIQTGRVVVGRNIDSVSGLVHFTGIHIHVLLHPHFNCHQQEKREYTFNLYKTFNTNFIQLISLVKYTKLFKSLLFSFDSSIQPSNLEALLSSFYFPENGAK